MRAQTSNNSKTIALPAGVQEEIDSLKTILKTKPPGTDRFKLFGKICWAYATNSQLDAAKEYADSIQTGADRLNDEWAQAYAHFYYGLIARFAGSYSTGLDHLEKSIDYYVKQGDSVRLAASLFQVGVINHDKGDYEKSLSAMLRVLAIWQKENDQYQVAMTSNSIAILLKKMKRYDAAIDKYHLARIIFDSLQSPDRGYVRTNLGNVYAEIDQYEKASQYYREAVFIYKDIKDDVETAVCLQNIANMFNKLKQHDSALIYHLESLSILQNSQEKNEIGMAQNAIGNTYTMLGNYALAENYLQQSLSIAKEISAKPLMRDVYMNLSTLYAKQKNYARAYANQQLYSDLKDSVLNETTTQQLSELQTKYEAGEKDKQIQLLAKEKLIQEKEVQRQRTLTRAFIGGAALLAILTGLLVYIFRQRLKNQRLINVKNEQLREVDFKRQMSELEMRALRAQINPHFLFNCMNSINRMILNGEAENASYYLTKFSKLVRLILENAESPKVSLENELALLESYIQLEELRFKGKINYKIEVENSIDPESIYLPSMVLQPFVENAIWHGLMHKEKTEIGNIHIGIKEDHDLLRCIIEDNGVGRELAQQLRERSVLKKRSMGMSITEERLRLMSEPRMTDIIRITDLRDANDRASGTRVEINIPIS